MITPPGTCRDRTRPGELTDEALLLGGPGRTEAFNAIHRRHAACVYGVVIRIVRDPACAEDVVQEVFERLWANPRAFDPARGSLRAFLVVSARGRSVDVLRSDGARRAREARVGRLADVPAAPVEHRVLDLAQAEQLHGALAALRDHERRSIELAYFGAYSYRQVAAILGEPPGTVKGWIRSGLRRLSEALASCAEDDQTCA